MHGESGKVWGGEGKGEVRESMVEKLRRGRSRCQALRAPLRDLLAGISFTFLHMKCIHLRHGTELFHNVSFAR